MHTLQYTVADELNRQMFFTLQQCQTWLKHKRRVACTTTLVGSSSKTVVTPAFMTISHPVTTTELPDDVRFVVLMYDRTSGEVDENVTQQNSLKKKAEL